MGLNSLIRATPVSSVQTSRCMRSSRLSNDNLPTHWEKTSWLISWARCTSKTIMHLMIGKLLHDTGWATVISQAEVLTSGRAQSTLNDHHIKRTRYAHEVALVSLYMLKQSAYVLEVLQ